jgi:hypothetical protein
MNVFDKLYNIILTEEVYGNQSIVYHRTQDLKSLKSIIKSGYRTGRGNWHGDGLYTTYDLESQMAERMVDMYGDYIIAFKVSLNKVLILNPEMSKKVYGRDLGIKDQLELFNITTKGSKHIDEVDHEYKGLKDGGYSSSIASDLHKFIENKVNGILFTSDDDGNVLVIYNTSIALPFKYGKADRGRVKWKTIDIPKGAFERNVEGGFDNHLRSYNIQDKYKSLKNIRYFYKTGDKSKFTEEFIKNEFSYSESDIQGLIYEVLLGDDLSYFDIIMDTVKSSLMTSNKSGKFSKWLDWDDYDWEDVKALMLDLESTIKDKDLYSKIFYSLLYKHPERFSEFLSLYDLKVWDIGEHFYESFELTGDSRYIKALKELSSRYPEYDYIREFGEIG